MDLQEVRDWIDMNIENEDDACTMLWELMAKFDMGGTLVSLDDIVVTDDGNGDCMTLGELKDAGHPLYGAIREELIGDRTMKWVSEGMAEQAGRYLPTVAITGDTYEVVL